MILYANLPSTPWISNLISSKLIFLKPLFCSTTISPSSIEEKNETITTTSSSPSASVNVCCMDAVYGLISNPLKRIRTEVEDPRKNNCNSNNNVKRVAGTETSDKICTTPIDIVAVYNVEKIEINEFRRLDFLFRLTDSSYEHANIVVLLLWDTDMRPFTELDRKTFSTTTEENENNVTDDIHEDDDNINRSDHSIDTTDNITGSVTGGGESDDFTNFSFRSFLAHEWSKGGPLVNGEALVGRISRTAQSTAQSTKTKGRTCATRIPNDSRDSKEQQEQEEGEDIVEKVTEKTTDKVTEKSTDRSIENRMGMSAANPLSPSQSFHQMCKQISKEFQDAKPTKKYITEEIESGDLSEQQLPWSMFCLKSITKREISIYLIIVILVTLIYLTYEDYGFKANVIEKVKMKYEQVEKGREEACQKMVASSVGVVGSNERGGAVEEVQSNRSKSESSSSSGSSSGVSTSTSNVSTSAVANSERRKSADAATHGSHGSRLYDTDEENDQQGQIGRAHV